MNTMRFALATLCIGHAAAYTKWRPINCPATGSTCSYDNTRDVDEAVSVFFQAEILDPSLTRATMQCTAGSSVVCHRDWHTAESGSAGLCFFMLAAGERMTCTVDGSINIIGAHASALNTAMLAQDVRVIASPLDGHSNTGAADEWVTISFDATTQDHNEVDCEVHTAAGAQNVCSYAVSGAGGSSCAFFVPEGGNLKCRVSSGAFYSTGTVRTLTQKVIAPDAETVADFECPKATYPDANMCDCAYKNTHDVDLLVSVTSQSVDDNYNNFHCYLAAANVCGWGSNSNNKGDKGSCYFILPAGETLTCQMQYGAASFSLTTARVMTTSLWSKDAAVAPGPKVLRGATIEGPVDKTVSVEEHAELFAKWKATHNRTYASAEEEAARFHNFRKHMALPRRAGTLPNHLADWSRQEFEDRLRGCAFPTATEDLPPTPAERVITAEDIRTMPKSVDWRQKLVTPVKDQGQCGSCWTFSTTGAVEGAWAMAGNSLESLSEQMLVSCDSADGNLGCGGGWPYKAIDYLAKAGTILEADYPYVSGAGQVPSCAADYKPRAEAQPIGYYAVEKTEEAIAATVAKYGPVSIALAAMTQLWWPYTGGIMTGCCNKVPEHAVLIVGYGEEDGQKFWLIKNSWSESWGEDGYIRLERGTDQCGITSSPVQALVRGGPTPPPPPPTPAPPTPAPPQAVCPPSAVTTYDDGATTCTFRNGTNGVMMAPPNAVRPDCNYALSSGELGYIWHSKGLPAGADYPCPDFFNTQAGAGDSHYCMLRNASHGIYYPDNIQVDCGHITEGYFAYSFRV